MPGLNIDRRIKTDEKLLAKGFPINDTKLYCKLSVIILCKYIEKDIPSLLKFGCKINVSAYFLALFENSLLFISFIFSC